MNYLGAYPAELQGQVRRLLDEGRLAAWLLERHPAAHGLRTDRALYDYVAGLKSEYLRGAAPLASVAYDSKLQVVQQALGTHSRVSRVQGGRLKAKREIRIAALFRDAPLPFLRMICVHELAHLKEREHDRAFYQLCAWMEPDYHQLEFELRVYLTWREATGGSLWFPPASLSATLAASTPQ